VTLCYQRTLDSLRYGTGTSWTPSPLGEGWGEGLSANCTHHVAAGFSPQSVQELFAVKKAFKN